MMPLEIETQRALTTAFIRTSPVQITLTPRSRTKTSSGGWKFSEGSPRTTQTMKVIESGGPLPSPVATLDGIQRTVQFELLGEWDATVENYDVFTLDGHDWEVVQVAYFNGWEQRALVSRFG